MSSIPISILLVEDSPSDAARFRESLAEIGPGQFQFTQVGTLADGLARLSEQRFDVLVLDLDLPDSTGRDTFLRTRAAAPELPILVLTRAAAEAMGLEAAPNGIPEYLLKGQTDGAQTARAIRYAIKRQHAELELRRAREELELRVAARAVDLQRSIDALQREVEQRKQAEQALRESEERYRTLFESAPLGIALSTCRGEVIAFNRSLCALAGVTPEEARTLPASVFHALPATPLRTNEHTDRKVAPTGQTARGIRWRQGSRGRPPCSLNGPRASALWALPAGGISSCAGGVWAGRIWGVGVW